MNLRNLMMWGVIVLLVLGLYNLFQNPGSITGKTEMPFSTFLTEVDKGNVASVDIRGSEISGTFRDGKGFKTYSPNYPNLVEKLTAKGVSITAGPREEKGPSLWGIILILVSYVTANWCMDIFHASDARGQRWCYGIWKIKSKITYMKLKVELHFKMLPELKKRKKN